MFKLELELNLQRKNNINKSTKKSLKWESPPGINPHCIKQKIHESNGNVPHVSAHRKCAYLAKIISLMSAFSHLFLNFYLTLE